MHARPIGSGQQDVGYSGVATRRGAFSLSSSSSVGDEEPPTDESFTLSRIKMYVKSRGKLSKGRSIGCESSID
ncbi:hypothetical protein [Rummeliibacillus suwonensis]|uniref:hypothetical protein n=1 Tax=Rummeliibacillus suwonensis TaxID=1306154 RepID=UPI0011B49D65|nr:hypothetical protein [Rummeliibacillus suwonensis]